MSTGTTVGSAPAQDPEDVFELPTFYHGLAPLQRTRQPSAEALIYDARAHEIRNFRGLRAVDCEALIADGVRASRYAQGKVLTDVGVTDVTDVDALTPLQAALVESMLRPGSMFGVSVIDLWGDSRGLAFAVEAFIEYCDVWGLDSGDLFLSAPEYDHFRPRPEMMVLSELVRSAPDPEYAEVVAVAERLRATGPGALARAVTSFLFPERPEWFWADLDAAGRGELAYTALLPSASTLDQATALAERFRGLTDWRWAGDSTVEATFLTAAGSAALPFLTAWCDSGHECQTVLNGRPRPCPIHRRCLDAIGRIPTDAALAALLERIDQDGVREHLQAAIRRFPRRALRVLAESAAAEQTTRPLTMVVLADPDRARAEAVRLSPQARDRIEALLGDAPAAESLDLPEILAAPPWRDRKRKRVKPVVVEGLAPPAEVRVAWLPGERQAWLSAHGAGWAPDQGWEAVLPEILDGTGNEHLATYFAAYGPDEVVRAHLPAWRPPMRQVTDRARTFVAKHEFLALPTVLSMTRFPAVRAQLLQPFVSAEIAAIMADGLVRLRSMRPHAAAWLRRHPEDAVRSLVPTALGKPGKLRQNTVTALRWLEAGGIEVVALTQQAYGGDAATAIKEVLADRGFEAYPRTLPRTPLWAHAALLAEIRLKDSRIPLPNSAAQAVVEMLLFSKPDAPYPGLEVVRELCDATSLAEFVWSLYEGWEQAGGDESDRWVVGALGVFGDEVTVARLEELIRSWHRRSKYDSVCEGLDALAAIGGDRALTALHGFSRRSWATTLKRKAQTAFEDVADSMDLTADRLADRLVPTSGLTAEGTVRLDYGRRRFDVSFDEFLRPVVVDETGTRLKTLPKPGKRDDADLATASYRRFVTLKKQVQDGAREQSARLERAMLQRRRWVPADFAAYVVRHLVLGRLVRRLVWGVYGGEGRLLGSFRIAEDLSFADFDDAPYEVPEGALIGVAHPVDLGLDLGRWSEVFSDYEILQPFDQLGRPPLTLSAQDRAGKRLVRPYVCPDTGAGFPSVIRFGPARFEAMVARGWRRGPIGSDRMWCRLIRPVGEGCHVIVELTPGLEAGAGALSPYQAITAVWLSATGDEPDFETHALPLSALDDVAASVILRDLEEVS